MTTLAWISLVVAFLCAIIITIDEIRRPQKMAVMNIVWPVTALYLSVFALWAYFALGVEKSKTAESAKQAAQPENKQGADKQDKNTPPTPAQVAVAVSHCGAGCTLGDIAVEFSVGAFAVTLFGLDLWASMIYGLIAAWLVGIAFQYFSIQPMRHLPPGQALLAAIKADTFSILAFQTGMYGWMILNYFVLTSRPRPTVFDPRYWLSMQIAMILGFVTAYPMNQFLIRHGFKEKM